jgi:anti-sigma factor (TIGR02949 family)
MNVIDFGQQSCQNFRRYLDAYVDNELLVETTQKMMEHLDRCPECRRLTEERQRLKRSLRDAARAEIAPAGLEARIRQNLRAGRSGSSSFLRGWMAAAAALVVLLGSGYALRTRLGAVRDSAGQILKVGLADHVHCTLEGHYPDQPPADAQMRAALGHEYAAVLPVVQQAAGEFVILAAHICKTDGRAYAHVILRKGGALASVVIARKQPGETFPKSLLLPTIRASGLELHASSMSELQVAGFETKQHLVYFVSNLTAAENKLMALKLAPGLDRALRKES